MSDRKTIFDVEPYRRTDMHEHSDGSVTFNTVQDVQSIIDANKRQYNDYGDKLTLGKRGEWHKCATVPTTVLEQWIKETNGAILKDDKLMAAYLNNPDNKFLKTSPTDL
jgi:hypothetical protein